jgi:hypothetical protein
MSESRKASSSGSDGEGEGSPAAGAGAGPPNAEPVRQYYFNPIPLCLFWDTVSITSNKGSSHGWTSHFFLHICIIEFGF